MDRWFAGKLMLAAVVFAPAMAVAQEPAGPDAGDVDLAAAVQQLRAQQQVLEQQLKALEARAPVAPDAGSPAAEVIAAPAEPFAFAEYGWLNGNSRQTEFPLDTPVFSPQFMFDGNYAYSAARPLDHTIVASTASGRHGEFQMAELGVGGDFHYKHIRGRVMTQLGLYSTMTPRNDSSPSRGQWDLSNAYRYIAEAYAGWHFDVLHGINVDAGIFMSYVGLCSYYDYENWVYQPSYVSANTPWFFNGVRIQVFPSDTLKIEPWIINGWQSYGAFNEMPGLGMQLLWRPHLGWLSVLSNNYFGFDTMLNGKRARVHDDTSVQIKYRDEKDSVLDRGAFSITADLGCEEGGGVSCFNGSAKAPSQYFAGFMVYNRLWFFHDLVGLTLGIGAMSNPGRYLTLLAPINGATAASGTPYFTLNPGDHFKGWDASATLDFMPSQFYTLRLEFIHRAASVPYFSGHGGITPPGGNQGAPGSTVEGWAPDLATQENRVQAALMVRL